MTTQKPGANGEFPNGKIHEDDEGELRMTCGVTQDGLIILDFGKPVAWLGLQPEDVDGMVEILQKNAAISRSMKKG